MRRLDLALAPLALAASLALASCSTAPKPPEGIFDQRNKAAELAKLGDGFMAKAQYSKALEYYEDALKADSALDDLEGVAASHASMGKAYLAAGQATDAAREYAASLDYARFAASGAAQATALSGLGEIAYASGSKDEALDRFAEAVKLARAAGIGAEQALAVALHDQGVAELALGKRELGMADLQAAEAMNLKARRWIELGANRYTLASALSSAGRPSEALAAALGALDADKRAENARSVPADLAAAASISEKLGKASDAWDYWRRSFDAALSADDPAATRKALSALVRLALGLGKDEDGKRYASLLTQLDQAESAAK